MHAMNEYSGGCLCGAIRYRARGTPYFVTHCHCVACRRASGAPFVTWFTMSTQDFSWTQGEPAVHASSPPVKRMHCATCGTQLAYLHRDRPQDIDLTVGSLDHPEALVPSDHTFVSSKLPWISLSDNLPAFLRTREDD